MRLCNQMGKWMDHSQNLMDLYAAQLRLVHPRRARRARDLCHFECGLFEERESNPIWGYLVRCSSLCNSASRDITSVFWSNLYLSVPG